MTDLAEAVEDSGVVERRLRLSGGGGAHAPVLADEKHPRQSSEQ